ncbi:hypothetical protein BV22DRAFT_1127972 [Leucogyrophana mollusca]|uniref:Uncharacterized protein n=1 Tax=Leucogyrophana mollusca TaxID=85980 RepID=A0ACB8BML1_9AGAM|nr:hypothetical protein BV22DRAFT_1127972 [Leucogyrophana mollusca]
MLKERGHAYLKFLQLFEDTKKSTEDGVPCPTPGERWKHAVDDESPPPHTHPVGTSSSVGSYLDVVKRGSDISSTMNIIEDGSPADGSVNLI